MGNNSLGLEKKWQDTPFENNGRFETLCALGIDKGFAEQLESMFSEINATVKEIAEVEGDIIESNSKIVALNERRNSMTNLAAMKAANDDSQKLTA